MTLHSFRSGAAALVFATSLAKTAAAALAACAQSVHTVALQLVEAVDRPMWSRIAVAVSHQTQIPKE